MQAKALHDLIEPTIQALGLSLWACDLRQQSSQALLRIYIDREDGTGVSLEDCTTVSREVGAILDVEDPIKSHYQLEVSSPGLDRVLITLAHFERFVGHDVKVRLRAPRDNRRTLMGRIDKVADGHIFLAVDEDIVNITLVDIQKANLAI